ncbi:DUF2290 domain-containing protein [Rhizobium brockwellii]|uniref:DUF2290 domain-containing protein n=1 Tax=Rhizobium brockwellii TaxID=3019932 RepID=A0ABU3YRG3_9HYPH|nr:MULTISPECIES: DUF2290 domain-containing protein [Rhizobium]MDV4181112.1 DUF2290 domain-containing protein [Rhizobium brockwellii]MDV4188413.1 DUF2290 domain-containing protein [Rhizobium brockwellii]TBZ96335.1 DUF2290 domain-containing protein [Rhizobium leguminosarum bv. viciae]
MTISLGKFKASCNEVIDLIGYCDLLDNMNAHVRYPHDMPSIMRKLTYRERWRVCIDEGWYDVILSDGSLFQFRYEPNHLSYSYIVCPFAFMSFEDFAFDRLGEDWREFELELQDEYELYRTSDIAEQSVTPIRYDYEPLLYRKGFHPAGHLHFGIDSHIRVGTRKVLTPLSFLLFILRQNYPVTWEKILAHEEVKIFSREIRENLVDVGAEFFSEEDAYEHYLV